MNARAVISLVAMLAISIASVIYMRTLGLPIGFDDKQHASMTVNDTNGLVIGSRILFRGTDIGTVTDIEPDSDGVSIGWEYDDQYKLAADSTFRVDNLSALGETYISVLPNHEGGPYLADGEHIDDSRVKVPSTIKDLSERFTRLLNQLDPDRIQSIFDELDTGLPSGSETIDTIEKAGALTAAMLQVTNGSLTDVLKNAQTMLLDSSFIPPGLSGSAANIAEFGKGFDDVMGAAVSFTLLSPLPDSLALGTGPLLENVQAFLDRSSSDIKILAVDLLPAAQSSAQALRTINVGTLLDRAMSATNTGNALSVEVSARPK